MKKQIEQLLSGKFKYDQPQLLFSKEKLSVTLEAGKTARGELYLGTEDNDKIKGYITSSNRRLVPGNSRFSGTTVCIPYGADGTGMEAAGRSMHRMAVCDFQCWRVQDPIFN